MYGDFDTTLPREVPLTVKLRMLFGGWLNQFGWAWLAFSSIFIWVGLGIGGTVSNPPAPTGTVATAKGVITEVNKTNTTINKSTVYAYHFKFQAADGKTYDGTHKGYEGRFKTDQPVTVAYSPAKPAQAIIQGARDELATTKYMLLFVAIFPLVGIVFLVFGVRKGLKGISLLGGGKLTYGELISVAATGTRVNNQTVYKYTFEFAADGQVCTASAKTYKSGLFDGEDNVPQECVAALAQARSARPVPSDRHARVEQMKLAADRTQTITQLSQIPKFLQKLVPDSVREQLAAGNPQAGADSVPVFEPLMYDPVDPSRAVMLDELPGGPRLDQSGQIQGAALKLLPMLIVPLLTIGGNLTAWQIMLRHRTW